MPRPPPHSAAAFFKNIEFIKVRLVLVWFGFALAPGVYDS